MSWPWDSRTTTYYCTYSSVLHLIPCRQCIRPVDDDRADVEVLRTERRKSVREQRGNGAEEEAEEEEGGLPWGYCTVVRSSTVTAVQGRGTSMPAGAFLCRDHGSIHDGAYRVPGPDRFEAWGLRLFVIAFVISSPCPDDGTTMNERVDEDQAQPAALVSERAMSAQGFKRRLDSRYERNDLALRVWGVI